MQSLTTLPYNLPIPLDDGTCHHLLGKAISSVVLTSTNDKSIDLAKIKGWLVIYCYPKTGQPNKPLPTNWDAIPGARGCTPQSCAFRDHYQELKDLGTQVFGLSVQTTEYQKEAVNRLHLPFSLLSDEQFKFTDTLGLPTFNVEETRLNKRVTLISFDGIIEHYFYPVFPPDKNADEVITWLTNHV